jgi:hypothetical protein
MFLFSETFSQLVSQNWHSTVFLFVFWWEWVLESFGKKIKEMEFHISEKQKRKVIPLKK